MTAPPRPPSRSPDDRFAGDVFTDSYGTATFTDKNVGTGKAVSVSGISISGADAGNYTFNTTATTTANITGRALTVSAVGVNKVYDGGTTAIVHLADDRISGDVFDVTNSTADFADKNVGTARRSPSPASPSAAPTPPTTPSTPPRRPPPTSPPGPSRSAPPA